MGDKVKELVERDAKWLIGFFYGITDGASIEEAWNDATQQERDCYIKTAKEHLRIHPDLALIDKKKMQATMSVVIGTKDERDYWTAGFKARGDIFRKAVTFLAEAIQAIIKEVQGERTEEVKKTLEPAPRFDDVYIQGANNMDKPTQIEEIYRKVKCPDCAWNKFQDGEVVGMTPCSRCDSTGYVYEPIEPKPDDRLLTDEDFIQLFTEEQKRQGVPDRYNIPEAIAGNVHYHRMLAKAQDAKTASIYQERIKGILGWIEKRLILTPRKDYGDGQYWRAHITIEEWQSFKNSLGEK